jgi:hypothetical protein
MGDLAAGSIIRSVIMSLTIGTQLGSHEITALLGKGGMGEVYLRLDRDILLVGAFKPSILADVAGLNLQIAPGGLSFLYISIEILFRPPNKNSN